MGRFKRSGDKFRDHFLKYKSKTIENEYNNEIEMIKRKNFAIIFLALICMNIALTVYQSLNQELIGAIWRGIIVLFLIFGLILRNKNLNVLDGFMMFVQLAMMINSAEILYPRVVKASKDEDVLFGVLTTFTLFTGLHYFQHQFKMLIFHIALIIYFNFSGERETNAQGYIKLSNLGLALIYISIFYFDIKFKKEQYYDNWMKWRELRSWKLLLKEQLPSPILILNKSDWPGQDFLISFCNTYFENSFNIREHRNSIDHLAQDLRHKRDEVINELANKIVLRTNNSADNSEQTLRELILDKIKQLSKFKNQTFQFPYQNQKSTPVRARSQTDRDHLQQEAHIVNMVNSQVINDQSYQNFDKLDTLYGTLAKAGDSLERTFRIKIGYCFLELKTQIIIIFDEVTEIEQNKRLHDLNRFKDEVLGMVSHDLKTPLYCIEQLVESGQDQTDSAVLQQNNQIILQSCRFLLSMIHSILDYTQIQMGKLKLVPQDLNFYDVVQDVFCLFRQQADQKRIELSYEGPAREYLFGKQDSNRIKQVLINLVSNSFKYTDSGSIKIKIRDQLPEPGHFTRAVLNSFNCPRCACENCAECPNCSRFQNGPSAELNAVCNFNLDACDPNEHPCQILVQEPLEPVSDENLVSETPNLPYTQKQPKKYSNMLKSSNPSQNLHQSQNVRQYSNTTGLLPSSSSQKHNFPSILLNSNPHGTDHLGRRLLSDNQPPVDPRRQQLLATAQPLLLIEVEDTGSGMPEDIRENLFKPFNTFDHHQGSNKYGVGLGLMICDKIVRLLGPGTIRVSSSEGTGSSFYFAIYRNISDDQQSIRQSQVSILVNNQEDFVQMQKQSQKRSPAIRNKNGTYSNYELSPSKFRRENFLLFNSVQNNPILQVQPLPANQSTFIFPASTQERNVLSLAQHQKCSIIPQEYRNQQEQSQRLWYSEQPRTRVSIAQLNSSVVKEPDRKTSLNLKQKRFSIDNEDGAGQQQLTRQEIKAQIQLSLQREATHKNKQRLNILIIDDELFIIYGIKQILSQFDKFIDVFDVSDGIKAVELISQQYQKSNLLFDYILVDMNMPTISGLQTIKKINESIKNLYPKDYLSIVLSSAQEANKTQQESEKKNFGFHLYLTKPIDFPKLHQIFKRKDYPKPN